MANEKDENYEAHEEGEYHFSDDQMNYDVDANAGAAPEVAAPAKAAGSKKALGGAVAIIALAFLAYKIIAPSGAPSKPNLAAFNKSAPAKPADAPQLAENKASATPQPSDQGQAANPNQAAAPASSAPVVIANEQTNANPTPNAQQNSQGSSQAAVVVAENPGASPMSATLVAAQSETNNRVAALEDQTAKIQADLSQKLADVTTQASTLQTKLQDLSTRLNAIENSLNRLSQAGPTSRPNMANVGAMGASSSGMNNNAQAMNNSQAAMPAQPSSAAAKMMYTVQAIIPGRAWLKSASGDTVTVAEGDSVRDFGRILKIDPYDGLVDVDMNGKTVSLSYGATAE